MALHLRRLDPGVFTVDGVFSPQECQALIHRAETLGFAPASVKTRVGPQMLTDVRNNDRVNLSDAELAREMESRILPVLPILDGQQAIGVDVRLRFYRYEAGQQFKSHRDGIVTDEQGRASKLSYLVYLNEDFVGGETAFAEVDQETTHVVTPRTGMALLFRHRRRHEGRLLTAGEKYVLRTDVFYAPPEEA